MTQNWCPAYFFFFELESLFPIFGSYWVANTFNVVANVVNAGFLGFDAVLCHVTAFDFWGTCKRQGSSRRGLPLSYMASCCQGRHPGAQQFKHPVTFDFLGNIQIVGVWRIISEHMLMGYHRYLKLDLKPEAPTAVFLFRLSESCLSQISFVWVKSE